MLGKNPQHPRHRAQLLDSGHVADIALNDRLDVVEMPVLPAAPARTGQRLGVAAGEDGFHEVVADDRCSGYRGLARERLVEEGRGGVAKLRLGERQQADDSHAARERIRDTRERHQVGGSGEQEPAGARVGVDGGLDGQYEARRALNLVDDRPIETANETDGIVRCGVQDGGVVERMERRGVARNPPRQRGLARLTGSTEQDDPGVRQGLPDPPLEKAGIHDACPIFRPIER